MTRNQTNHHLSNQSKSAGELQCKLLKSVEKKKKAMKRNSFSLPYKVHLLWTVFLQRQKDKPLRISLYLWKIWMRITFGVDQSTTFWKGLCKNYQPNVHEIWCKGAPRAQEEPLKFWSWSDSRSQPYILKPCRWWQRSLMAKHSQCRNTMAILDVTILVEVAALYIIEESIIVKLYAKDINKESTRSDWRFRSSGSSVGVKYNFRWRNVCPEQIC